MQPRPDAFSLWERACGLLCLCAYLGGAANILPGVLATAALLEGTHVVQAHLSEAGCELVLHHESRNDCTPALHRHGLASHVICFFAAPSGAEPDHVLHMANGAVSEKVLGRLVLEPVVVTSDLSDVVVPLPTASARFPGDVLARFSVEQHPPARAGAHLLALRVTVLVI